MKTENTPENNSIFRALYYGQEVLQSYSYTTPIRLTGHWIESASPYTWLSLRSISSLTLSEAKVVSDLQEWKDYESPISEDDRRGIRDAVGVAIKNQWFNYTAADYLRSIGILIPWMDLSVEDIKSYGWAKEVES